jgi:hypothetical protein
VNKRIERGEARVTDGGAYLVGLCAAVELVPIDEEVLHHTCDQSQKQAAAVDVYAFTK